MYDLLMQTRGTVTEAVAQLQRKWPFSGGAYDIMTGRPPGVNLSEYGINVRGRVRLEAPYMKVMNE